METAIKLTVNGAQHTIRTDPQRPLLDVLREDLQLTGTKYGCGEGACGACTVLMDGKKIFSCSTPAGDADGKQVLTIQGLAPPGELHPVQQAFLDAGAFQCGYCTPGMIMATVALLKQKPNPTEQEIVAGMNGNLCRCCGYVKVLEAVRAAAQHAGR